MCGGERNRSTEKGSDSDGPSAGKDKGETGVAERRGHPVDVSGYQTHSPPGVGGPRHILTMPYPGAARTTIQPIRNATG
jgi:hypothetical protein